MNDASSKKEPAVMKREAAFNTAEESVVIHLKDVQYQLKELLRCHKKYEFCNRLSDSAKIVGYHLIESFMHGRTNVCFPSVKRLSEDLDKSQKTIRRAVKELEDSNFITVVRNKRGRKVNKYYCSEVSLKKALKMKEAKTKLPNNMQDNIVPINSRQTYKEGTNLSFREDISVPEHGQNCPPNLSNKTKLKNLKREQLNELPSNTSLNSIPINSTWGKAWVEWLGNLGVKPPIWMISETDKMRVPMRYPDNLSPELTEYFQNLADHQHDHEGVE